MTAHRTLQDNFVAEHLLIDPGTGETVNADRTPAVLNVTTTAAETRVIAAPSIAGQELTIFLGVDGGNLVVTQAGSLALNQAGNTTLTLADAGDLVVLIGVNLAGTLVWRIKANDGTALS